MIAMPLADAYGLAVTAASRAAVDAYDRGVRALLGFGADTTSAFQSAVEHDPDFAVARAGLAVSLYLDEKIPEGRAAMDAAAKAAPGLPERERRHVEALALWVGGRGNEAIDIIKAILADHPRDVVLLQRLYFIYFWQGRSADMLELTRSVVDAFHEDSYVLGLHAFSLEENCRFDEALSLAERAMALNPRDAWAVHAMAHVHYERGDNARGVQMLPPRIHPCDHLGYFKNHLVWHLALMHLAHGDYERVGRMFQGVFGDAAISVGSDLQDAVALAWRLDLFGHPDPRRWQHLGAAASRWLDLPLLLFHDVHVAMALAASGDWASAELQLDRLRERAKRTRNATLPEVVVPLVEGLHAFARGDDRAAAAAIEPIEPRIVEIGGSHAQREIFHDTLLAATLRAGEPERARQLLERRLAKRPNPGHYWTTLRGLERGSRAGSAEATA
jgi:tetratricopeptide (TPR) repeat protein